MTFYDTFLYELLREISSLCFFVLDRRVINSLKVVLGYFCGDDGGTSNLIEKGLKSYIY